jgi:hypothetical protein
LADLARQAGLRVSDFDLWLTIRPTRAATVAAMKVPNHFPGLDRQELIVRAWPQVFPEPEGATYPLTVVGSTLIVLCQTEELRQRVEAESLHIVHELNGSLELHGTLLNAEAVLGTRTEIYLAREILWLKVWLRDHDLGF